MQVPTAQPAKKQRYRSKVDLWLPIILGIILILPFAMTFSVAQLAPKNLVQDFEAWLPLIVGIILLLLLPCISLPMYYEITTTDLVICSGLIRRRIPLTAIQRVAATHNPLVSFAWSLDRLQIDYCTGEKKETLFISPKDKTPFLQLATQPTTDAEIQEEGHPLPIKNTAR